MQWISVASGSKESLKKAHNSKLKAPVLRNRCFFLRSFESLTNKKAITADAVMAFLVRVFITDSINKLLTAVKHTLFQAIINNRILSCEFNIDTAYVEVKLTNGLMVSV